jgi:4-amino-4-deoxy-L-arabinose transferase-like glycosyltransferase
MGVGTSSDPAELVQPFWPEFAIRLPGMLFGLGSTFFLGMVAWRLKGPRAGILVGLVLATMPQWAMATRQAITDVYFVGPVVVAGGSWAMAWLQPDRDLKRRGTGLKSAPWDRAYLAFLVVFVVAAVVPLAVVHQHAFDPLAWKYFGKNPAFAKGFKDIQVHMFLYWALALVVVLRSLRWTKRSQAWMGILYLAGGLSLIGKGLIGPGIVGAIVLAHIAVSGRWGLLRRCGLVIGTMLFVLPAFPWHHAMVLYRGDRWVNELIIQNNLQRFSTGEQKQAVGGFSFYVETLGLAALPWSALVPASVWRAVQAFRRDGEDTEDHGGRALHRFAFLWFVVSLLAISYSTTKYYHYLIPVLPPLALMTGVWLDDLLERGRPSLGVSVSALLGLAIGVVVVRDALLTPTWLAHLTTYLYTGMWTKGAPEVDRLAIAVVPFAAGLVVWALAKTARTRRFAVGAWLLSGLLTTGWLIADYIPASSENWSQRTALRMYFAERGPNDRIISWWFYYRGETFFTKGDIWVMKNPDRGKLADYIAENEGKDAALWFITIEPHAKRLAAQLPTKYRDDLEEKYRSFHYVMMRLPLE